MSHLGSSESTRVQSPFAHTPTYPFPTITGRPSGTNAYLARAPLFPSRSRSTSCEIPVSPDLAESGRMIPLNPEARYDDEEDPFSMLDTADAMRARTGKAVYSTGLPPGAEWMLLTTAPHSASLAPPTPVLSRTKSNSSLTSPVSTKGGVFGKFMRLKAPILTRKQSTQSVTPVSMAPSISPVRAVPRDPKVETDSVNVTTIFPSAPPRSSASAQESPRSWAQYTKLYARGDIDVESPPSPPSTSLSANHFPSSSASMQSPFDERNFPAPRSVNEAARQRVVTRLDLLGTFAAGAAQYQRRPTAPMLERSSSQGSEVPSLVASPRSSNFDSDISSHRALTPPPSPEGVRPSYNRALSSPPSMRNSPALLSVLNRCRLLFETPMVIISVLTATQQLFLASEGMPDNVETLPRSTSYCAHTVLNGSKGLVIPDTQSDWRFQNNVLTVVMQARFYAGMPVFVSSGSESCAIGTICVMDTKARQGFTEEERSQLRSLASEVSSEIESWVDERSMHYTVPLPVTPPHSPRPRSNRARSITGASPQPRPIPERSSSLLSMTPSEEAAEARYKTWQADVARGSRSSASIRSSTSASHTFGAESPISLSPRTMGLLDTPLPFAASSTFAAGGLPFPSPSPSMKYASHRRSMSAGSSASSDVSSVLRKGKWTDHSDPPFPTRGSNLPSQRDDCVPAPESTRTLPVAPPLTPLPEERLSTNNSSSMSLASRKSATRPAKKSSAPPPRPGRKSSARRTAALASINPTTSIASGQNSKGVTATAAVAQRLSGETLQDLLDKAVLTLGRGLNLTLSYLVVVDYRLSDVDPDLTVLSTWNRGPTLPSFSPALHLKALRAPEGGLLYRNPNADRLPDISDSESEFEDEPECSVYASGILIPVADRSGRGIVLGGYTRNPGRKFTSSELQVFVTVAQQVAFFL